MILNRIRLEPFISLMDWFEVFMTKGLKDMPHIALTPLYPSHLVSAVLLIKDMIEVDGFNISTFIHFQPSNAVLAATKKG